MATSNEMLSDEDFLISQVMNNLEADPAAAKSWMIFSKSVFPQSFKVLFQSYKMECDEKNLTECALCLSDLIKKFPNEITLIKELRRIADSLCSDTNEFLKKIFEQLSEDIKYDVMLSVTRSAQSIEEHCELMLLFLKRMPNARFMQHGSNIVETLLSAEDQPGILVPLNRFRKMLICDALPLILRTSQFDYKFKIIFQLLQKAVEFYVCYMFTPSTPQDLAVRKDVAVLSDGNPDEGWKPLLKLFETVALRYRWNYPEMFVSNFSELSLQQLLSLLKRKNKLLASITNEKHRREETSGFEEAYFCLVITFFYYLYHFSRLIHPKIFTNVVTGPYNYVLMEGISFLPDDCPKIMPTDFKRTDRGYLVVSKSGNQDASLLAPSFITAVECWELLLRHQHLMKEFNLLRASVKLDSWPVFQEFYINSLIYRKMHRDAIDHLNRTADNAVDITHKNKIALQMASCYFILKEYEHALKLLFDVIINLTPVTDGVCTKSVVSKCPVRYMYFMRYNNSDILQYCIAMLLKMYKSKDKIEDTYRDMALGYMLILIQYNLENEFSVLNRCLETIRKGKTFCFSKFFKYIIHSDILEEVSHLGTLAGGNVNLEILSTSTFQASKQRAITRGVNKGARDDLKQAFINQMARCSDNLDNLFIEFFKEEQTFLLLPLSNGI